MFANKQLHNESKCHICKRIFCCGNCRQKHQFATHAIAVRLPPGPDRISTVSMADNGIENGSGSSFPSEITKTIYVFCPICEQKPLLLREEIYAELLAHIESAHLPLNCRKCQRRYTRIEDLREFSKCADVAQSCSARSDQTCDTDASKITVKRTETSVASNMSTQTSPNVNDTQHKTPISLINLHWKAKGKVAHEEFISDSMSSIRNISSISNSSVRRSIGQLGGGVEVRGKIIRSTSTPLQVDTMFAKPKEPPTFMHSSSGGHMSSIYNSGYGDTEQNSPAPLPVDNNNAQLLQQQQQQQQRVWKIGARNKMSAATPLRQVMSKSIQKAFVEHGGMPAQAAAGAATSSNIMQRRIRLDLSENSSNTSISVNESSAGIALDLRLSPALRRTQSESSTMDRKCNTWVQSEQHHKQPVAQASVSTQKYHQQILLSAQKLTTESIIITRTKLQSSSKESGSPHIEQAVDQISSSSLPAMASSSTESATSATVYNSCESVEIITSTAELSAVNVQVMSCGVDKIPPITPLTRIPGAIIPKKLIKFETPKKAPFDHLEATQPIQTPCAQESEAFYTPIAAIPEHQTCSSNELRRQQIKPRQLSDEFGASTKPMALPPPRPRPRPPLRKCNQYAAFSSAQDFDGQTKSDDNDDVFMPTSASTHNEKVSTVQEGGQGAGRFWSLMTSVIRLPAKLRGSSSDKENSASGTGSLIKRCASIAGSFVRTRPDEAAIQSLKRKRTQTLDTHYTNYNSYCATMSPASSSKRFRIQPRKPIDRMRFNS
ncbi:mitosis initiation protein fs(1)Ya [Scaptodrosophila lebanonensis]|uniref:Mitosis initiation protein fs(1)Ya n=1 Tax=Drosophila lebanonensis TaxID=7225 RepID=A0A6J2TPI6_DROLE|nr:mitosis initiation protein fs(1)Ya [Scaptodrosophila lebanonensis]